MRRISAALLLFASLSSARNSSAEKTSVLFVGNSYTYVNDLPRMFSAVAESLGDKVEVDMAAPGGASFENHVKDDSTRAKIRARAWTFVVLQEQSQRPDFPDGQLETQVIPFALRLDEMVHDGHPGTRTVFFETWGHKTGDRGNCASMPEVCTYDGMQNRLNAAYAEFARRTASLLAPVGASWSGVRLSHPEIELYQADGIHPSKQGTYLAACVFYAVLFKRGVVGADHLGLKASEANILQRAAQEIVFHGRNRSN